MARILVVIPAYNCAPQIGRVIDQFTPEISKYFDKIVVVNNRSTDGTAEAAQEAFERNPHLDGAVYTNVENLGYGGSLKVGFELGLAQEFDYVLVLHGDDQGHVKDMLPHIADGSFTDYDCTLGARFHRDSEIENYSAFRTFGNRVFNWIFGLVLGVRVLDLGSGLNLYRLESMRGREYLNAPDNLTFDYCGLMAHRYLKRRLRFVPISWREDDQISNVKITQQALQALRLLMRYAVNPKKFLETPKMEVPGRVYASQPIFEQSGQGANGD